jgi:hypothetical protein
MTPQSPSSSREPWTRCPQVTKEIMYLASMSYGLAM